MCRNRDTDCLGRVDDFTTVSSHTVAQSYQFAIFKNRLVTLSTDYVQYTAIFNKDAIIKTWSRARVGRASETIWKPLQAIF